MTEQYWQRYVQQISLEPLERKDKFWQGIQQQLERRKTPKHHLQLYSMCRSDNPYIRQVRSSPNITTEAVSELICRDKACQLQYCLSLQKVVAENRRSELDLKGCQQQYDTMRNCINVERKNLIKREQQLRNAVFRIHRQEKVQEIKEKQVKLEESKIYI